MYWTEIDQTHTSEYQYEETLTAYHGSGEERKSLKAKACELGFPKGVWLTENKETASGYANRHPGNSGAIATVSIKTADIISIDDWRHDFTGDDTSKARQAVRAGAAVVRVDGFGYLVVKSRKAGMKIEGWEPATL